MLESDSQFINELPINMGRSAIGTSESILTIVRSFKLFAQAAINFREKKVMLYYATNPHLLLEIISWFPLLWKKNNNIQTKNPTFLLYVLSPESSIPAD